MFVENEFVRLHLWLAGAILLALVLLAAETGFRLGRKRTRAVDDAARSQFTAIEGSAMAVAGLLLAFTFSMSVSRFENRKQIVVLEANALGTAYLRARLLPPPQRQEVESSLRRYVDAWLEYHQAGPDLARGRAALKEMDLLQERLWSAVSTLARENPNAVTLSLILQALNDVFDRQSELTAAVSNRVPGVVLLLLALVCAIAMGIVGRGCGLAGPRSFVTTLVLSCMLVAIILVILDFDRPRRGLIQISPQSMIAVRQSMGEPTP